MSHPFRATYPRISYHCLTNALAFITLWIATTCLLVTTWGWAKPGKPLCAPMLWVANALLSFALRTLARNGQSTYGCGVR